MRIRAAQADELGRLQDIEVSSGAVFRGVGLAWIADDPPMPLADLAEHQRSGRAWVSVDADVPVAFVVVEELAGSAHIAQISVHADYARRGIGRALLDHVGTWAHGRGLTALTLTTFREVPWNAPYYERLGFRETAVTPELAEIVAREAAHGLDPADRVCMRRPVHA